MSDLEGLDEACGALLPFAHDARLPWEEDTKNRSRYHDLRKEVWERYAPEAWQDPKAMVSYSVGALGDLPWPNGLSPTALRWVLNNVRTVQTVEARCQEATARFHEASLLAMPARFQRKPVPPFAMTWHVDPPPREVRETVLHVFGWAVALHPPIRDVVLGSTFKTYDTSGREITDPSRSLGLHPSVVRGLPKMASDSLATVPAALNDLPCPYEPLQELPGGVVVYRTRGWASSRDQVVPRPVEVHLPI